jgi:dTDP-4-amino-4,6-dideoxygalactose transaminase
MNVKLLDLQAQYATIRDEVRQVIDQVCETQALCLGPWVERFEKSLAAYCGVKHAIGVTSGTDALLCSLMALGIDDGDEVICPSFTFFATAGSIARLGARPVFADIDPHSFNIDPDDIARKITRRTKAIIPVHLFGQVAQMERINELAARHDLKVIEDACQAIGAGRNGTKACAWGFAGCLSFYPTKNLGAFGDAGAICTNDDAFAECCRHLRVHGMHPRYHHHMIGGMFRMGGIQGAVLDVKLKHLEKWHDARRRNAALYDQLLAANSKIIRPAIDPGNRSIYNQYVIRVPDRDRVKQRLADRGIGTDIYYPIPLHLQECFAPLGCKLGDLPQSERACHEVLALPIYPELPEDHLRYVAAELIAAVG